MKKKLSRLIDVLLIVLIIYLSFKLLQKFNIIDTKLHSTKTIPSFSASDLYGEEITNDIFADYDFTIIPVWSTICPLCAEQFQALDELQDYITENNGNILGILKTGTRGMAVRKVEELGTNFNSIVPNAKFKRDYVNEIVATPTLLFVDRHGNILDISVGGSGKEGDQRYIRNMIDKLIDEGF